jgi:hypothetical protein
MSEKTFENGKAGGEHNLKHYLENPPVQIDENILPGWRNVRNIMKY